MDKINVIKKLIEQASKKFKVQKSDVTPVQFWTVAKDQVSEWEIRKVGGFTTVRDFLFPNENASKVQPHVKKEKKMKFVEKKLETFKVNEASLKDIFKECKLKDDDVLRIVVQPDTHVPEYDEKAISVFLQFLSYYKPHGIINLGDFMEMGAVSHWDAYTAEPRRLVKDVKEGISLLQAINEAAGPQCVFKRFLIGNHEDWLNQYLVSRIPEVLDGLEDIGPSLKIEDLLSLKDLGYRTIPLNEVLKVGKAHFIHGYYTGQHHASKHLSVFGVNLYYGHLHDVQVHSGVSVNGIHEAASLGCLRSLNAPFLKGKPNAWQHAFGIFEVRKDGSFTRYIPTIIDGVMSFNGKLFSA